MGLTEQIREYVCENYIKPARQRGDTEITIRAGDVHSKMRLTARMPAVCNALKSKIEQLCNVAILKIEAPPSGYGANFFVTYRILRGEPTLTVTHPKNGQSFSANSITVSGTASDAAGIANVTVNGELANGTTSWDRTITLTNGTNNIKVVATNNAGKTSTVLLTITYTPPVKPKMFCPVHQKISIGYLKIENSRPILICGKSGNCNKTLEINCDKFVIDTSILANGLFSELYNSSNLDFFKGKTVLVPETAKNEIDNWKDNPIKRRQHDIAQNDLKRIIEARDEGIIKYVAIDEDPTVKGRNDRKIAKIAEKENAIVVTSDRDYIGMTTDSSVIYYEPKVEIIKKEDIIEVTIVEKDKANVANGIGYYKTYRISIAGAANKIGNKVTVKITEVDSNKQNASAKIIGK